MSLEVFTAPWADALCAALTSDLEYRAAAARWEGDLVLAMADATGAAVLLDLWHGACRGARPATAGDREAAPFVIEATAATWQRVLEGDLDPLFGLMSGTLVLARGHLAKLLPFTAAAKALVAVAARLDTRFPA